MCVVKLKNDPNNSDIHSRKEKIQLHILSLGKCQRLRKAVQSVAADGPNGPKVSIASIWNLNNNNHITNNNETKHETVANGFETKPSKEYYEEVVTNGDVPSPVQNNDCAKRSPSSVGTASGEDDIVEVPMDENSNKKEETKEEYEDEIMNKEFFLRTLELITKEIALELQNKRAERKRRSTANPHFVYSMVEQPAKRQKKQSYMQSGNAPHTRQAARMNGPSPPPSKAQATKSTSQQARAITKLIPVQKSNTRPNILRNADSKVFVNKNKIEDKQTQSSVTGAKTIQIGGKTVHLPGLPSSLTIERIENESVVCITCRNKSSGQYKIPSVLGPLTVCEICSRSYHVTCHTMPAPPSTCPKCAILVRSRKNVQKQEEAEGGERMDGEKLPLKGDKLVATTLASGANGKAGEDSEVYQTSSGLHKVDANEKKRILSSTFGVNKLPASTFLIPITSDNTSSDVEQFDDGKFTSVTDNEQRQDVVPRNPVVLSQPQRSGITYVQAEEQMSYSYQLPGTSAQPEKHQSYLIVKKITESGRRSDQPADGQTDEQGHSAVVNYQLPTTSGCSSSLEAGIVVAHSLLFGRNNRKRKTARAIPALHRIIGSEGLLPVAAEYQLDRATINGRKPWTKLSRGKFCISQQSSGRPATETLFPSYSDCVEISDEHLQIAKPTLASAEETASCDGRLGKHRSSRAGTIVHSLFSGNNRPYIISDRARESRGFGANDRDCPLLRQQLCRLEHEQLESREQSGRATATTTVQLQRRALTRFFEHVKLEEAHIPAPLRTKLVHKSKLVALEGRELDSVGESVGRKGACDRRYDDAGVSADAALLTSSSNSDEDSLDEETRRSRGAASDIAVPPRDKHEKDAAKWSPLCRPSSVQSPSASNDYERARQVKSQQSSKLFFRSTSRERKQKDDAAGALSIAQSNLSELLNEVSVPDDKADTERQDLPSGGRPSSRSSISSSGGGSSSGNSNSSSSSSSSSGHSDTPEQAMNGADGLAVSHITKNICELLNDNPTSPGEEELVRYVSAMGGGDDDDDVVDADDDDDDDDDDAVTG
ncbi:PHD finger protein 21A [Harpegnathos saltator]|uniref:PHD finger protein 21A n=1 Tax=Harpegnathos saltator TaxID=610380 RepID=E2BJI3_HARSA|nr:PHD finger protein 21A [Harpegnathos saltator]